MWVWGKHEEQQSERRSISQAAAEEASRDAIVECAVRGLLASSGADRIGVWLEPTPPDSYSPAASPFRGLVADLAGESTLPAWSQLTPTATLPQTVTVEGKILEQDFDHAAPAAMTGPLLEMCRAIWVPIVKDGHLRGVIFAGSRKGTAEPLRQPLEQAAAELLLVLDLEDQHRLARQRQNGMAVSRRVLASIAAGESPDSILTFLAESCTETAGPSGDPVAVFAAIGEISPAGSEFAPRSPQSLEAQVSVEPAAPPVFFSWTGGDPVWTRSLDSEPLAAVWHQALRAGRVLGGEAGVSFARGEVHRVLALPLDSAGQLLGVLVAGLPQGAASLATLERLELRASLAAFALQHRRRTAESSQLDASRRVLLEGTRDALVLVGPAGDIAAMSAAARELLGESAPQSAPDPTPCAAEPFASLFARRERKTAEIWLRANQGVSTSTHAADVSSTLETELRNNLRVRLTASPANVQPAFLAVRLESLRARDFAAHNPRAEAELVNVLEWLEEGVLLFDQRNSIRAMNTRFAQLAGLAPKDAPHLSTLEELIVRMKTQAADPEAFAQRWRDTSRGVDSGLREEVQLLRPVARVLERASRPVLDRDGRSLGRVEIYRDLTSQRVFQSKLLQTEKLAALGQMVGGIAHELSNPLTTIMGYAQRLLLLELPNARSRDVSQIFQEAERATAILKQLLLSARDSRPERRRLSLNQVVSRALELQRFSLRAEKVRVQLDLEPALPFAFGDTGHLQQVVMNLMANARQAIQHARKGGIIVLRTRRSSHDTVSLEVSDDGPGVPEAIHARIFDPFFTTKPVGVGTGLGLAVVLGIVREHGGRVTLADVPGGGAAFTIDLPAAAAGPDDRSTAPHRLGQPAPEWSSLGAPVLPVPSLRIFKGARVLVVEDEPTVARLIAEVLEDEGLAVDLLLDGRDALLRAASETYDLAICDMKMPGLDGPHFHAALARAGNPLAQRFLFVTGDVLAIGTREFLDRHRVPYLAKPFRIDELTEKVYAVLSGLPARQSAQAAPRSNVART